MIIQKIKNFFKDRWDKKINPSPDGIRYLSMGSGHPTCKPFYFRWLAPFICKSSFYRWNAISDLSTLLLLPLTFLLLKSLECSNI
ncbi:MAG: hypothetical protein RL348_624, partial [Bacteroidota bacterium]